MPRTPWFDEKAEHPLIQEQIDKLESYTSAMSDGIVSKNELGGQEQRLLLLHPRDPDVADLPGKLARHRVPSLSGDARPPDRPRPGGARLHGSDPAQKLLGVMKLSLIGCLPANQPPSFRPTSSTLQASLAWTSQTLLG